MNCPVTVEIGAYLLGAVSPADRMRIQAHLYDCPTCQQDVINLSSLPGLLSRITFAEVPEPAPADGAITEIAIADGAIADGATDWTEPPVKRRGKQPYRRRRQWLLAAAAAAIVAGGTIGALLATGSSADSKPAAAVLSGTDPATGLRATARMQPETWGTEVDLQLGELPRNAWCQLVVHTRDGQQEIAGSWSAPARSGNAQLPTATSFKLTDISSLAVVTNGGKELINLTKSS